MVYKAKIGYPQGVPIVACIVLQPVLYSQYGLHREQGNINNNHSHSLARRAEVVAQKGGGKMGSVRGADY